MGKGKSKLLKILFALGIGYAIYKIMHAVVDKLIEEEEGSENDEEKSDKGSAAKKRK